jgi:hypothetical protein
MLWVVGALALLFVAASASRRKKQRVVERAWRAAVLDGFRQRYARRFGNLDRGITEEEAAGLTSHFFTTLYRRLDVANFPDLARALVLADRRGEGVTLEFDMADAVASRVPLDDTPGTRAREASMLRLMLSAAGASATAAGRASGEV